MYHGHRDTLPPIIAWLLSEKYTVIIPTYNERESLHVVVHLLVREFMKNKIDYEIIIVDDDSPDGTLMAAHALQSVYGADKIILCPRESKIDRESAIVNGLMYASGNFVVIMSGDLSHHPRHVIEMIGLQRTSGADVVCGSRFSSKGVIAGPDVTSKLLLASVNHFARIMMRSTVSDLSGSFRLYKKDSLETLLMGCRTHGYAFQMDLLLKAMQHKYSIVELPITYVQRLDEYAKFGSEEIVGFVANLFYRWWTT